MKKFLLTVALVLAVVTSLTAGTMAAYNTTINVDSAAVTAKVFAINTEKGASFDTNDITIGPGDSVLYKFTVKNDSEISADINAVAEIVDASKGGSSAEGTKLVDVCELGIFADDVGNALELDEKIAYSDEVNVGVTGGNRMDKAEFTFNGVNGSLMEQGNSEKTFFVKISWPYSEDTNSIDNDVIGVTDDTDNDGQAGGSVVSSLKLSIKVTATSVDEDNTYGDTTTAA